MRTAERCSSFFQDNQIDTFKKNHQVALIKFNETSFVIFGPKKMVKNALHEIEVFNWNLSSEEDKIRIVSRTLDLPGAPNPLFVKKLTLN